MLTRKQILKIAEQSLAHYFYRVLGLFVLPFALRKVKDDRLPTWAWVWGNDHDGLEGPDWYKNNYAPNHWFAKHFPRYWWLAIRNPANNMRHMSVHSVFLTYNKTSLGDPAVQYTGDNIPDFTPTAARVLGRPIKMTVWKGDKAGYWYIRPYSLKTTTRIHHIVKFITFGKIELGLNRHFRFRIGYKLLPEHSYTKGKNSVGFTPIQLLPYRKG